MKISKPAHNLKHEGKLVLPLEKRPDKVLVDINSDDETGGIGSNLIGSIESIVFYVFNTSYYESDSSYSALYTPRRAMLLTQQGSFFLSP